MPTLLGNAFGGHVALDAALRYSEQVEVFARRGAVGMRLTPLHPLIQAHLPGVTALLLALSLLGGCSVKGFVIDRMGNALAEGGSVYATDDDPALVAEAVPFGLKLVESLLAERPNHRGLRFAAASGFTQYAYAFVEQEADRLEDDDLEAATALRLRARRLYLRARDHALAGLAIGRPDCLATLPRDPRGAARAACRQDAALLYWAAAAWGAAIAISKTEPDLVADQPIVEALIDRALEVDESLDQGAVHVFLIAYEPSRIGAAGDGDLRSRRHFERAVALSGGRQAAPFVTLAETGSVRRQDREEFERLLRRALAIDPDAEPRFRLANLVMQRRARWLLSRADRLFLE